MEVAIQLQSAQQFNPLRTSSTFVGDLNARMNTAKSHGSWQFIVDSISKREFVPSILVIDVARKCPLSEIKQNLLTQMRDFFLNLPNGNALAYNEGRICTFVTASSLTSASDFLRTKVLVTDLYGVANMPIPKDVLGRFNACQRVIADESGYTRDDLISAGYEKKVVNARETYVHPRTKDAIVLPDSKKLAGGALLSKEEQAKRAAANLAIRMQAKQARKASAKPVKLKTPKKDASSDKKDKKSGGNKK